MQYLVLTPGGPTYGPVDLATLNTWTMQGRVLPTTELIRSDGLAIPASAVPGLGFPATALVSPPVPGFGAPIGSAPYYIAGSASPSPSLDPSGPWTKRFSGIIGASYTCALFAVSCVPLVPAIVGLVLALVALKRGSDGAAGALVFNLFALLTGGVLVYSFVAAAS